MLAPDTLIHDRYCIVRLVGQGAMGAVYEAIDQRIGQPVALKQTLTLDSSAMDGLEREALILAGLRHPALPIVSDTFSDPLGQFLAMTFVPGPTLADMLAQRRRAFVPTEVLAWADQILDALIYLHEQGTPVLHRDIKPQNLKLTPEGAVMLLDFGLARGTVMLTRLAGQRSVVGYTLPYAPIEQVRGQDTDPRSDLFALAGTLYHLLTGAPPPDALERAAAHISGRKDPLKSLHDRCPELPPAAAEALDQCLSLDPSERTGSARELRQQLQQTRSSWVATHRQQRPARAEWGWRPRAALLTLVLIGAGLIGWGGLRRSSDQRAEQSMSDPYAVMNPTASATLIPASPTPTAVPYVEDTPVPTLPPIAEQIREHLRSISARDIAIFTPTPQPSRPESTATPVAGTVLQVLSCVDGFNQFGVSSDGQIVAIDCDQQLQGFRITDGQRLLRFEYKPQALALSHDGTTVAFSANGDEIQIWSLSDMQMVQMITPLPTAITMITNLAFSSDGKTIIAVGDGKMVAIEAARGKVVMTFPESASSDNPFIFSPSGRYFAVSNSAGLEIWEYTNGQFSMQGHNPFPIEATLSIAFNAEETSLVVGSMSGSLHRYSLAGEHTELPLPAGWDRLQVAVSPVDNLIAIGDGLGKVAVYREGNSPALHMIRKAGPQVKSIVFTPDGQAIMVFTKVGFEIINLGDLASS